jgi:N-dimethylarginine dimethylaminohydrolase
MPTVLLCPPTYFDVIDVKNPFMQGSRIDRDKAHEQWQAVCRAFIEAGCKVEQLEPIAGLEDMVFAANQTFVGAANGRRFAVPSRMRHESRRREVPHYLDFLRAKGYEIIDFDLPEGEFLEGHGDLLWDQSGKKIFAGYGFRSTKNAVAGFAARMTELGIEVVPLELQDERFYHLDTCFAPLGPGAAMVYFDAFHSWSLSTMRRHLERIYELSEEETLQFICNGVAVNGRFITPKLTPNLEKILAAEKLQPLVVDTSEFEKSGGSVFCMKLMLP